MVCENVNNSPADFAQCMGNKSLY